MDRLQARRFEHKKYTGFRFGGITVCRATHTSPWIGDNATVDLPFWTTQLVKMFFTSNRADVAKSQR